jgi:hypothetical protein
LIARVLRGLDEGRTTHRRVSRDGIFQASIAFQPIRDNAAPEVDDRLRSTLIDQSSRIRPLATRGPRIQYNAKPRSEKERMGQQKVGGSPLINPARRSPGIGNSMRVLPHIDCTLDIDTCWCAYHRIAHIADIDNQLRVVLPSARRSDKHNWTGVSHQICIGLRRWSSYLTKLIPNKSKSEESTARSLPNPVHRQQVWRKCLYRELGAHA